MDGGDTSDFLSRERAALGADADQFSTPQENSSLPGMNMPNGGGNADLLGGEDHVNGSASQEMNDFQSSFPPVSTQNEVGSHPPTYILLKGMSF